MTPDNDATAEMRLNEVVGRAKAVGGKHAGQTQCNDCGWTLAGDWSEAAALLIDLEPDLRSALREKAARDAAPADLDLTPSDLEVLAREYDNEADEAQSCVDRFQGDDVPLYMATKRWQLARNRAKARALRFYAAAIDGRSPAVPPAQPASQADEPRCPDCGVRVPRDPALATEHVTHSTPTPAASSGLEAEFDSVFRQERKAWNAGYESGRKRGAAEARREGLCTCSGGTHGAPIVVCPIHQSLSEGQQR